MHHFLNLNQPHFSILSCLFSTTQNKELFEGNLPNCIHHHSRNTHSSTTLLLHRTTPTQHKHKCYHRHRSCKERKELTLQKTGTNARATKSHQKAAVGAIESSRTIFLARFCAQNLSLHTVAAGRQCQCLLLQMMLQTRSA